jgi:nucleoside-diphosphate-sugar epimerase
MKSILIAGCGYVGLACARLLQRGGWRVVALTLTTESAAGLANEPFPVHACDLSDTTTFHPLMHESFGAIIHCASSGRGGAEAYRRVYLNGCRNLAATWPGAHLLFTSSTSVYSQNDGSIVTEESPADPNRETGLLLRETEQFVLAAGGCAARLAGIYGPGRSVLLRKFFSGEAVIEDGGSRWINQIHRDDAASALAFLASGEHQGYWNVSDNGPMTQLDLYTRLAEKFHQPVPPRGSIDPNRKRGVTSKRVSNAKLRAAGWTPRWPDFFSSIDSDPSLVALAKTPPED